MTHDNPDTDLADDVTDSLVDYEHLRERNDVRYQERRDVVDPAVVDDVAALPDMAGVGITNDDGELLFRRLTDTCEWKIPVVNVDPGEDFAVAISDHVRETIGFEIELAAVETVREITLESEDGERTASRAFVTFSGAPVSGEYDLAAATPTGEAAEDAGWFADIPPGADEILGTEAFLD